MTRRGLLGFLTSAAAAAVADPERLLWRPGAKLISIPKPRVETIDIGLPVTVQEFYFVDSQGSTRLLRRTVDGSLISEVIGEPLQAQLLTFWRMRERVYTR